ncbi:MAG TPA: helix-turn-helix transcriptional regulator [Thermoanaerobaculia bacterium]|nr:helix-turn-helix transcriptional regulator [Thermoanaerobaculia bacterium]
MAKTGDASVSRLVVGFLRLLTGESQTVFGKAARVAQTEISKFELGKETPPEEKLRRMAKAAGLPWPLEPYLRRFFTAVLATTEGPTLSFVAPPDWQGLEHALLTVSPYFVEDLISEPKTPEAERREAEEIWAALQPFPMEYRHRLIALFPRASRSWVLAVTICEASVRATSCDAQEPLGLADLALWIAGQVPGEARRCRVQGFCWAYAGNSRRVATDFDGADEAFARAWTLWQAGAAFDSELLPEWRLLSLEASLRREQLRFSEALDLLARARVASRGNTAATGRILVKRSNVCEHMGDSESALAVLLEAAPFVESTGDPDLLLALRFNTADNLGHLEKWEAAAELLPAVRELAAQQGGEMNRLRLVWLEARTGAGLGRAEEAMAGLEQVRRRFTDLELPYEAALSSLELAVLWLEEGRTAEVRELSVAMKWIFEAKGIQREALAALQLFRDAAERETATVELACRVIAEIKKAEREAPPPKK